MNYKLRYKNTKFSGQKIELDGTSFDRCEFEDCMIVLERGETEITGSRFRNCQLLLRGNAYTIGKIINLFSGKGPMKVVDFQEPLFERDSEDALNRHGAEKKGEK
jgi:hypothetical protein